MAIDTSVPRTRRALLVSGFGGLAALVASAVGRPLPVRAADGQAVLVGGEYKASSVTKFDTGTTGATALWGRSSTGQGVQGSSSLGFGVTGTSDSERGVYGYSASTTGVHGAGAATGVLGTCETGWGVHGASDSNWGVVGRSRTGTGVYGTGDSGGGVHGQSTAGRGVYGQATTGVGLYGTATTGYALRAVGRVKLDKCAGVATIATGTKSIVVTPGSDLVSTSAVVATLQGSAGGTTTVHRCVVNGTANTFTIYLTANSTTNAKVAWHVFG